jgi:NAD-dependent deacetylase
VLKRKSLTLRHSKRVTQAIHELAILVRERQPVVVLTGAGISTESGIPDFRSPTGLWAEYDPMEYATIRAFRRDPVKVWEFYALRFSVLREAEPNAGHRALAELERRGLVQTIVTQNIDGLHQAAGSEDVLEVHGSIRTATCLECGKRVPLEEVVASLEVHPAPPCRRCGAILKPDVVMFGELLPPDAIDRAVELARAAGLLLAVGSSLEVYPVAGPPGGDGRSRRDARDCQPWADALRPAGRNPDRRDGGRDARGRRGGAGRRYAAARLIVFSSSRRWQLEQTFRSTWYGTPARCRIA